MVTVSQRKHIADLRKQGLSGNKIAKQLHLRKQDVLSEIRKLENKPIQTKKITNIKGQASKVILPKSSEAFIEALYKQGYPENYIAKLVNAKHTETSQYKVKQYLKQYKSGNADAVESHKANMKFYKATGKWQQHLDAKYYRETETHWYKTVKYQFKESSPKLEVEEDLEGGVADEIL